MVRESLSEEEMKLLRTPVCVPEISVVSSNTPTGGPRQDQSLVDLHLNFAAVLGEALSEMTHRKVSSRMRDEWLGTYAEFVFGQPTPTCCAVIKSKVRELEFYLAIDPKILFPLLDRLLGSKSTEPIPRRPLSEIERTVSRLLIEEVMSRYAATWEHTLSLELAVDRIEHNLQQMSGLRGSDSAYITRYEVACDSDFGLIELCLPWKTTEQIRQRLAAR